MVAAHDGVTGVVVPPNDSSALGAALRGLLADDALRRRMGEAARARAVAEFDRPAMLERVMAGYIDVLTR